MPRLNLRGIDELSSDGASDSFAYEGSEFGTIEKIPQWWDKKQSPAFIPCNRIHVKRSCGDIDMLVPAAYDLSLKIRYDGDVDFQFDKYRSCDRVGITDHGSNEVLEEYIMPRIPGQAPTKRVFGPLISCFDSSHIDDFGSWYDEEFPMDAGSVAATTVGHYDLNVGNRTFDLN